MESLQKHRCLFAVLFVSISLQPCQAQLCTGSLGDPIVNIDFGAGTGRGPALGSSVTAYTYRSSGQLGEGQYTIANTTSGLKGNAWHVSNDHTGNANGYMMVVNCATLASEGVFYTKEVSGLCPNTTYEFSAWMMNVMNFESATPNVTFRVTTVGGTILGSYNTGSLGVTSSATWLQYGFYFNTGSASTVVIKILNSAPSAQPGNDLAIDDITFSPCGPTVKAYVNGSNTAVICGGVGNAIHLHGEVSSGYTSPSYQWQINSGGSWVDIVGANTIDYVYQLGADASLSTEFRLAVAEGNNIQSVSCRVLSNMINLEVETAPVASYDISTPVCVNQAALFSDQSTSASALSYYWMFGDGHTSNLQNPQHAYTHTGTYATGLVVTSANGCIDTANDALPVTVYGVPQASFSASPMDTSIFEPNVTISDASIGGVSCTLDWGDGSITDCTDITHAYEKYGVYTIIQTVTNENGCSDTASVIITKRPEYRIFIPNAFTPDGDGINEVFNPGSMGLEEYTMLIYNRWGQEIFKSNDTGMGWNGESAQIGVYVYYISYRDAVDLRWHEYRGSVTLLR